MIPPLGGPLGRTLWLSHTPIPGDWGGAVVHRDDGQPFNAIVLDDLDAREAATWQRRLAPGGLLMALAPKRPGRLARRLRPYFEGGAPGPGERYRPVRAERGRVVAYRRGPGTSLGHFDDLAEDYAGEIPAHLVAHYLERKMAILRDAIGSKPTRLGLDLGCGVGDYARETARALATHVVAVDASPPAVAVARRRGRSGVTFAAGDAQRLPFPDGTFDFAYTINMVHHLKRGEQSVALAEALRVLKPGAPLIIFEINVANPLFRAYMRHIFPRTRRIDRGDEEFLTARGLRRIAPVPIERVTYSTFIPDFTPRWLLPVLRPVERMLERVAGPLGIHYAAVLRR